MNSALRRAGAASACAVLAALVLVPSTATAKTTATSTAPAAAADAYGLDVDVTLTSLAVKVDQGPFARSTQEAPPQQPKFAEAQLLGTGQIPAGGAVVDNVGVLETYAQAVATPTAATAAALAADVALLSQGGTPLLTAEVLQAVSTTDCTKEPSAAGTKVAGLSVNGTPVEYTGEKNFRVLPQVFNPLGLEVVVNEQHPTADGRGLVVNALHIYNVGGGLVPGLFTGDVIVSHAMSTVNCPNGAPTTGADNDIFITKDADKTRAKPGETVTYTATFENNSSAEDCLVNQAIDHLPVAFEYVSTSGAFGTVATTVARPGGGTDVVLKPTGVTIPKGGGSVTQTFVVKVKDDAEPATYFNNVELLCGNLGNWVKGLDAPVEVYTDDDPDPVPPDLAQCEDGKDNDGDGKVDYPADPGCTSKKDDDERNELARTGPVEHASTLGVLLLLAAYGVRRRMPEC